MVTKINKLVSVHLSSLNKEGKTVKAKPAVGAKMPKTAPTVAMNAYADIDLPPEDEDEGMDSKEEVALPLKRGQWKGLDLMVKDTDAKKKNKKEMIVAHAAEFAKQKIMNDNKDAFSVTMDAKMLANLSMKGEQNANMKDIKIENFSVSVSGKELLKNTSITIVHGRRYGLVGPNGKGKSTLLKLLAWRQIPVPKNIDVLLVEQEVTGDEKTALESVVSADEELIRLRDEVERLQSLIEANDGGDNGDEADNIGEQLSVVFEKMQVLGADAAEARASKILAGLGFSIAMQGRATKLFSGGWRMRVSLARALFMQPTLLLLDEPTNHLDLRAVMWLEQYLERWKKTLIVVSHDREFLNSISTDIVHLHDLKLFTYKGNFEAFEEMYEQKRQENNKKCEVYEKQMKAAKKSGNKAQQDKIKDRAKLTTSHKDAKSKGKPKDDDDTTTEAPKRWWDYQVDFHFPEPTELRAPLLQLIDVSFKYPSQPDFVLKRINVGVDMGTRVAIVGPNGSGKSTLLNLLAGHFEPTKGQSRQSQKLRVGRYSQHFIDSLTMDETPVQYLLRLHPDQVGPSKQESVRAKLGKFGLISDNHLTPIVKLSGGQKSRVVFTSISMARPHILLLDEPTNHLDMQSVDALANALDKFTGGVVLVSHDARLISRVCQDESSEVWVVEDGSVNKYSGNFDDYKKELIEEIIADIDR